MTEINHDFERWKAENERWLEHYRAEISFGVESLRAVVAFAGATLKASMLANGAAALTLLAFLGHVVASRVQDAERIIYVLSKPMSVFAYCTAFAMVATACAYMAQAYFSK